MDDNAASFVLLMILFSIIVIFPNVEIVKAESTIYVRADGSIDPLTVPISTVDNITYTLTDNVYAPIIVQRNNIVIDGNGYTIQGTGNGTGIDLTDRENVIIKNTQINNFEFCIRLVSSDNIVISANNATTSFCGIWLSDSSNSRVLLKTVFFLKNSTATNSVFGF
jgi:parallel beta-helix repeat protein